MCIFPVLDSNNYVVRLCCCWQCRQWLWVWQSFYLTSVLVMADQFPIIRSQQSLCWAVKWEYFISFCNWIFWLKVHLWKGFHLSLLRHISACDRICCSVLNGRQYLFDIVFQYKSSLPQNHILFVIVHNRFQLLHPCAAENRGPAFGVRCQDTCLWVILIKQIKRKSHNDQTQRN